jgi:very-short-patch-repair endonuclease
VVRFNRQVPIGPFICDFVARGLKLIVELDGGQHANNAAADAGRTRYLEARGYRVIRFWNNDVLTNAEGVLSLFRDAITNMPSPTPPAKREGS